MFGKKLTSSRSIQKLTSSTNLLYWNNTMPPNSGILPDMLLSFFPSLPPWKLLRSETSRGRESWTCSEQSAKPRKQLQTAIGNRRTCPKIIGNHFQVSKYPRKSSEIVENRRKSLKIVGNRTRLSEIFKNHRRNRRDGGVRAVSSHTCVP